MNKKVVKFGWSQREFRIITFTWDLSKEFLNLAKINLKWWAKINKVHQTYLSILPKIIKYLALFPNFFWLRHWARAPVNIAQRKLFDFCTTATGWFLTIPGQQLLNLWSLKLGWKWVGLKCQGNNFWVEGDKWFGKKKNYITCYPLNMPEKSY